MARRRFLQPGFWANPLLSKCPPLTRLLFQVIWTHADFDGAFQWDPEALAMRGLPRDNFDPEEALERLERDGFVKSYMACGKRHGYVVNWHKHQDPHPGEKPVYPKPTDDRGFIVKVKPSKYREKGDTGFGHDEIPVGLHRWMQLVGEFPAAFPENLQGYTPATDKEGKEGKESPDQEKPVPRLEPLLPRHAAKQEAGRKHKSGPTLEGVLGPKGSPDWEAYWKLVGIFGAAKNPAPTRTAQAFVEVILTTHVQTILAKAQNLRDAQSDPKYMPMLQSWLETQGYLNPDAPPYGKGPSHRDETDAEWLAATEEGRISA